MTEYGFIFSTILHEKLKEKINGRVFVRVVSEDKLLVVINSYGDIEFKVFINDFSEKVLYGLSTDYAVYEIMKQYRRFVMNKFFK